MKCCKGFPSRLRWGQPSKILTIQLQFTRQPLKNWLRCDKNERGDILSQAANGYFCNQNFLSVRNFLNALRVVIENWRGRSWQVEILDVSPF